MATHGSDPSGNSVPANAPTLVDGAPAPAVVDEGPLAVGTTFAGRYHVRRRIGSGGMGAVYQAFDTVLSEDVAIKLIRPEILADPDAAADVERRFTRELLMGRRVSHPAVVRVHDVGAAQGLRYLTMSYVDGQDLARVLDAEGPMSAARVVRIGQRLGLALAAVHAAGVVHRDLKPANVMLGRGDQVWLTDFGIARLVGEPDEAGVRVGTPEYMAPEQAADGRVDERTDVYALGLVLHDLLTGEARRRRYSTARSELDARRATAPHARVHAPEVPEALDAVLARALDPEPARRFPTAASLVDALGALELGMAADAPRPHARRGPPAPRALAAAVAVGVVMALGAFLVLRDPADDRPPRATPVASGPSGVAGATDAGAATTVPYRSVAVLPFADLSEGRDQAHLADGIADQLLNELSMVPGLRVPGRTSSFRFRDGSVPLAEIGRQLGVAHVLEGSVRRAGDRLRVAASLVRVADGSQVFTKTYDRTAGDVIAVQDEIAAAVARAFAAVLPPGATRDRPKNPQAYELFLRAKLAGLDSSVDAPERAADLLRRAIALEPTYAAAWSDLSSVLRSQADATKRDEFAREAWAAAERAIALAPDRAQGYLERAWFAETLLQDWDAAQRDVERALELEPDDATARNAAAGVLLWQGRAREAIAAYGRGFELDPLRAFTRVNLAYAQIADGQRAAARASLARSLELNPGGQGALVALAELELLEGRPEAAKEALRGVEEEFWQWYGLALAEHSAGDRAASDAALGRLVANHAGDGAYQIAAVHAWRGETDRAFEWLERARAQRDGGITFLLVDQTLRGLHDDPRWAALVERVGLVARTESR